MRILAGTVFALFLAAGPAVAADWTEYDYPDQGVAIQFPAKPEAMKATYDSIYVKGLPSLVISVEDDHVIYKMTVVDLSTRSDMGTNFLNEAANRIERRRGLVHRFPARLSGREVGVRCHARRRSQ